MSDLYGTVTGPGTFPTFGFNTVIYTLYLTNSVSVENAGYLSVTGTLFTLDNTNTTIYNDLGATLILQTKGTSIKAGSLNNAGMLVGAGDATSTTIITAIFTNSSAGSINVQSGTLQFGSGGISSASAFTVALGATIYFDSLNSFVMSGGTYSVAGATTVHFGALDMSAGTGTETFNILNVSGASSLLLGNHTANIQALTLAGTLNTAGTATVTGAASLTSGTLTGGGTLVLRGASTDSSFFVIAGAAVLENAGTLTLSTTNGWITTFDGTNTVVNNDAGATLTLQSAGAGIRAGSFNSSGILVNASPAGSTNTISAVFTNSATGSINVQSGTLAFGNGGASDASAFAVASGATLLFSSYSHTFAMTGGNYTVAGSTVIQSGTVMKFASGGSINSTITNSGTIESGAGVLSVTQQISGSGVCKIDSGATLILANNLASGSTVAFNGTGATLKLQAQGIISTITGFAGGDSIDLINMNATTHSSSNTNYSSQVTLGNASGTLGTFSISGNLQGRSFVISSDGAGGTLISLTNIDAATAVGQYQSGILLFATAILDSAINVAVNIDLLQTLATAGLLDAITLTDSGTPLLSVTATQFTVDAGVLGDIAGNYRLTVTGVAAANASNVGTQAHVSSILVSDSAANVASSLGALQAVATAGKLTAIALTNGGTPTLSVTAAQLTADAGALADITGSYALAVTGAGAGNVSGVVARAHVTSVAVSDSASNVLSNLGALQTLSSAGKLTSITLTDSGTPILSVTATQLSADAGALAAITGSFGFAVTGVPVVGASGMGAQAHVTSVAVFDSAANVASSLNSLQLLAAASKLSSITLTDSGTPILSVTAPQLTADVGALADITGSYGLAVSGGSVAAATAVANQRAVRPLRQALKAEARATVRFETPPGKQLQIDFGEMRVPIGDEKTRVHLFVATLGYSRRGYVQAFLHERQSAWLDGTVFGDPVVATAILDRLLHHSHVITIRGDSYSPALEGLS